MKKLLLPVALLGFLALGVAAECDAHEPWASWADKNALRHARTMPWHGNYYHTNYGYPVPLIVPPTANMQTHWGWGVAQSSMTPIYHQFRRPYPGDFGGGGQFSPTPNWPSHTGQFGVYYVRGPW